MDYDLGINYHLDKANVVTDALSRRSHLNMLATRELLPEFCKEFEKLNLGWVSNTEVVEMEVDSTWEQYIRKGQLKDAKIQEIIERTKEDKAPGFSVYDKGTLWYKKRICVPEIKEIRELILREAHDSAYSIHPESTKMYHDLRSRYWWYGMKRAIAEYVALRDNCQRVKAERQRPTGVLQPLKIPEWKWEEISIDFIVGLPKTQLLDVHDVFHVSQLRKCLRVSKEQMPLEELTIGEDHTYQEYPEKILDTSEKVTRNNHYKMCKVQWSNHTKNEATWEKEDQPKAEFPDIFSNLSESRGRDSP
jgi:hypothetical protein